MEGSEGFLAGISYIWNLQCGRQNHFQGFLPVLDFDRLSVCRMRNDESCILYSYRAYFERNAAQSCSTIMDCIYHLVLLEQVYSWCTQKKHDVLAGICMCNHTGHIHISNDQLFSGRTADGIL